MVKSARIAPPNSVVLIEDSRGGEIPNTMGGELIAFTDSCIAVGSRSEYDGQTEILLGPIEEVDPGENNAFDGFIATPSQRIVVRSVLGMNILEVPVAKQRTSIRIWVNDLYEPDRIIIGVA